MVRQGTCLLNSPRQHLHGQSSPPSCSLPCCLGPAGHHQDPSLASGMPDALPEAVSNTVSCSGAADAMEIWPERPNLCLRLRHVPLHVCCRRVTWWMSFSPSVKCRVTRQQSRSPAGECRSRTPHAWAGRTGTYRERGCVTQACIAASPYTVQLSANDHPSYCQKIGCLAAHL